MSCSYFIWTRRNVTEFGSKVRVKVESMPLTVVVTGAIGWATGVLGLGVTGDDGHLGLAHDTGAAEVDRRAGGRDWALTTLTISSPVSSSRVTTWRNGSARLVVA